MEQKHKCNHHSHGNGFLVGVIVGVILTLLFTTKKGREIVKELTAKGLDAFSDFQKVMNETISDAKEATDEMEEELVELVEDEMGDYVPELSSESTQEFAKAQKEESVESVAVDSLGSGTEPSEKPAKNVEKKEQHKSAEKQKTERKEVKYESNGEAKSPKRFFLRKVKKK